MTSKSSPSKSGSLSSVNAIRAGFLDYFEKAGHAIKHGCRQGICHECTCRLNSGAVRDLTTGEQIHGEGQPVRLCVSAALSDLSLESLN